APALRLIATLRHAVRPFCGELPRGLIADPAVGARDDDGLAGLWGHVVCGPGHQSPLLRRAGLQALPRFPYPRRDNGAAQRAWGTARLPSSAHRASRLVPSHTGAIMIDGSERGEVADVEVHGDR